ncbi:MAG: two-component hybrid sensor and regulator [Rariglobus sp.]|jgi:signal transduction histidine kinase|nr:two-component hybrid sensor and regulator [Rariglobus sp.]
MTLPPPQHLLIVDDEAPHLRALCDTLSAQGYVATGFTSARAALDALRKQKTFDLVLTDLMMPEMDGIALIRTALEIDPSLACVVMTGHGTIDSAVAAMKQGAVDYILKPFKLSTVLPVISRALAARRLRLENEMLHKHLHARTLELEAANKELETFSYSVSHDLRAPLRAIGGYMELLLESLGDRVDSQSRTYADHVHAGVTRMNILIDDLLRLARTTRTEMHRMPVDLTSLVREIAEKLQAEAPGRPGEWIVAPDVIANGDPGLLRVMLENLLANAWKYTGKTARARVEFGIEHQPDGSPAYYVRDNGAGFDMKYAHRLFGPFQRLHSERDFPGTGVGLATVQRIIHKHGGRIWAQAAPDQGATFFFTLPPGSVA